MRFKAARNLLACALLAGVPVSAGAQPASVDFSVDVNASIGGDPIDSVDVFYDQLSPYGYWLDDPDLGRVFTPAAEDFEPYTNGHWVYTDVGFVWVSPDPFEWATAHYGRWAQSRYYDRWVWLPDTTWGPAWVEWREAGDDLGWAPLAPETVIEAGWEPPPEAWHYCPTEHVLDEDVTRWYEPRERVVEIHREARPIERYAQVSGARVIAGPRPEVLQQHRVQVRPARVDARAVGRLAPAQVEAARKRAEDRRAADEARNRERIQRDATLRERAKAAPAPTPRAPEPQRTQPQRTQPQPTPRAPEPQRTQPQPQRTQPQPTPRAPEPQRTQPPARERVQPPPRAPEPARPEPKETQRPPERREPTQHAPRPVPPQPAPRTTPPQPAPTPPPQVRPEPPRPAPRPEPPRAEPQPPRAQPQPQPPRAEPQPPRAQPQPQPPRAEPQPPRAQPQPPPRREPPPARDDGDRRKPRPHDR